MFLVLIGMTLTDYLSGLGGGGRKAAATLHYHVSIKL